MGKNNNNAAKSAAQQAAAQQAAPGTKTTKEENSKQPTKVNVIQLEDMRKLAAAAKEGGSLDFNRTMDMIRVQHETFRMDPKAAEHTGISQESIDAINRINAIEQVAFMATVITLDNTPFAVTMRAAQLPAITEAAAALGIVIDQKALPAPDEKGEVTIQSSAVQVPENKKEEIKEEAAAEKRKVVLDPTKIENEQQLKDTLLHILVKGNGNENFYEKVSAAINFYESYLSIQASKSENKEEELAKLKERSRCDFLTDISHMLGKCTFTISGMAKFMFEHTEKTKSPVVAFCTFRKASLNKTTGMPQIDDTLVADIVKVLIRWYADTEITTTNEVIAGFEKDIAALKKDEKKNAKGIEQGNQKIAHAKKHIEDIEKVVEYCNMPSKSVVDEFEKAYSDNKSEGFKAARMIGSKIIDCYYPGVDIKGVKPESLMHNMKQYIGVICNMFLPPLEQMTDYSEANFTELEFVTPEEPKNE